MTNGERRGHFIDLGCRVGYLLAMCLTTLWRMYKHKNKSTITY